MRCACLPDQKCQEKGDTSDDAGKDLSTGPAFVVTAGNAVCKGKNTNDGEYDTEQVKFLFLAIAFRDYPVN